MQIPRLRELRESRALTQAELADRAGLSERSVYGYEAGASARLPMIRKLAAALDLPVEELTEPPGGMEQLWLVLVRGLENIQEIAEFASELLGTEDWEGLSVEERESRVTRLRRIASLLREASQNATEAAREGLAIETGESIETDEDERPANPGATEDRLSRLLASMEHTGRG